MRPRLRTKGGEDGKKYLVVYESKKLKFFAFLDELLIAGIPPPYDILISRYYL